jgi:iron complex outermembrane receptor protein
MDNYADERQKNISLSSDIVDNKYLNRNLGSSLMNTLDRLPGVDAMNIGSGQSKPVIRGLSFNRVVVVENGIAHEGQQWGADHGLEIDQYAVDRVEVIRGPASLMYGSDAMGGVIDLRQFNIPQPNTLSGEVTLTAKSNNALVGGSAVTSLAKDKWFLSTRATWLDWGDTRVPADFVDVYSYRVPLYKNMLRNTAGEEKDLHFTAGYNDTKFSSRIYISFVNNKAGFFANAHGLEPRNVDTSLYDAAQRDIQMPYQEVNHIKAINHNRWQWKNGFVETNIGFQQNHRWEYSNYVSHGFMPPVFPDTLNFNSELELEFIKNILSVSSKSGFDIFPKTNIVIGLDAEYQTNRIGGRGFIIPTYYQFSTGGFAYLKKEIGERSIFQGGLRFDFGSISIEEYQDWFPSQIIENADTQYRYLMRASSLMRQFSNLTWSAGYNYNDKKISIRINLGKSFRIPIAKELAANGINYHYLRYERGDVDLNPEVAYQLDAGLEWNHKLVAIGVTPFLTWFENYIYLNPSFEHDRLYGNGNQIYDYTQAKVLRYGGEIHAHYNLSEKWKAGLIADYVYSVQMSGDKIGFTLPLSPPASVLLNLRFNPKKLFIVSQPYLSMDLKMVAPQNLIVPPEEKTEGYHLFNLAFGGELNWKKNEIGISFQVQNLLNAKYYNHTSFYRLINLPEAGRNFIINIKIPFKTFLKN